MKDNEDNMSKKRAIALIALVGWITICATSAIAFIVTEMLRCLTR